MIKINSSLIFKILLYIFLFLSSINFFIYTLIFVIILFYDNLVSFVITFLIESYMIFKIIRYRKNKPKNIIDSDINPRHFWLKLFFIILGILISIPACFIGSGLLMFEIFKPTFGN